MSNEYNDNYDNFNSFSNGNSESEKTDNVSYSSAADGDNNIYSSSSYSGDNTASGEGSTASRGFFDEDGNYRRRYTPSDQPSGGFSSTKYINNNQNPYSSTQQSANQQGGYYTTPQSYYTPTQNADTGKKKKKEKKKHGKGAMAAVVAVCVLGSGVLGFGGGMLATTLSGDGGSDSGMKVQKVVETVSTGSTDSGSMSTEEIVAKTENSVVEIITESVATGDYLRNYITQGAGSGVIVSENGYIVTNNHVIDGASTIKVTTKDGKSYDAKLVGTAAPTLDIALIKIEATGLTPATLGNSDEIKVGEKAVAIGNPLGQLGGTVTEGIISALNRDISIDGVTMNLLQTNAEINPGNSGGGLFDDHGNLIGIVVAKSSATEVEGIGFAIPVNDVAKVIGDLTEYGYVKGVVETGLSLLDISNSQTAMMYGVNEIGVYIQSIEKGSAAESAGFKRGDRIVKVDGKEISTSSEFDAAIKDKSVGDAVTVTVSRNGETADIQLVLEEYTPESADTSNGFNDDNINNGGNSQSGDSFEDFFNNFFN
ncbi:MULTISPECIES: S1C family serine protease [unclassified Ruminococcus]|uniref:S1C family serine protease n=1 Tax=unclassified Ruminococcus TaxID=2608920 RepID=UPI00210B1252|nr:MULTISPECIES: trypsin-like peptidase domain-containing protein [unclassified Ruminococcus]